jgi:hypothetical protein
MRTENTVTIDFLVPPERAREYAERLTALVAEMHAEGGSHERISSIVCGLLSDDELREVESAAIEAAHIAEAIADAAAPTPPNLELMARMESLGIAIDTAALSAHKLASADADAARKIAEHFLAYLAETDQIIVSRYALAILAAWAEFGKACELRAYGRGKVSGKWIEANAPDCSYLQSFDGLSLYDHASIEP